MSDTDTDSDSAAIPDLAAALAPPDPGPDDAGRAQILALRAELASLRTRVGQLESIKFGRVFLARDDGEDGAWQEVLPGEDDDGNGVLKDFAGGRSTSSNALIDPVSDDGAVWPVLEYRAGGRFRFVRLFAGLTVVKLTLNDGDNGDLTHAPTYTYDLSPVTFDSDDAPTAGATTLAENRSPIFARPLGEVIAPAAYGLAQAASDGGWVLLYAHEVPDVGPCEEAP